MSRRIARLVSPAPCFRFEALLLPLVLAAALVGLWLLRDGPGVRCLPAIDLYQLSDSLRVEGFAIDPGAASGGEGRLTLELVNSRDTAWIRLDDVGGAGEPSRLDGAAPSVRLRPGLDEIRLRGAESGRILEIRTQWGGPGFPNALVSLDGARVGEGSPFAIGDFVRAPEALPPGQVAAARDRLAPLRLETIPSGRDRIARLAAFLHAELEPHRGVPAPHMARLNGFEQYQEAMAGRSEVYCANHAEIYAFMATVAGLPTRILDMGGRDGAVELGAHTFAETWLEDEGRWVYVDLQLGLAGVLEGSGALLEASALLDRIRAGRAATLKTRRIERGRIVEGTWSDHATTYETFLNPAANLVFLSSDEDRFAPRARLRRLLWSPRPALCEGGFPQPAGPRLAATWLALVGGAIWVGLRGRHVLGRCACVGDGSQ